MIEPVKGVMKVVLGAAMGAAGIGLVGWAVSLSHVDTQQIALRAALRLDTERLASLKVSLEREAEQSFGPTRPFYGYYGDLNKEGTKTDIRKESYMLRFAKASEHVKGELSGVVEVDDKSVLRRWTIEGFYREPRMVLNILGVPTKEDPTAKGIGTYYLAKSGADYTGTAVYLDCVHRVVECPYALASDDMSKDQARARWPELFSRQCQKIDLTPGAESPALTC